jgi:hypothetical protein
MAGPWEHVIAAAAAGFVGYKIGKFYEDTEAWGALEEYSAPVAPPAWQPSPNSAYVVTVQDQAREKLDVAQEQLVAARAEMEAVFMGARELFGRADVRYIACNMVSVDVRDYVGGISRCGGCIDRFVFCSGQFCGRCLVWHIIHVG